MGSVCVCVFACAFLIHWHTTHSFSLMPKGSLAWTLLDSLALSLSLTLVLPHIIVCFTNFFFYSSHRTGHSVKSHMLYRIQTVLFVTFSLESVSVNLFFNTYIHISDFAWSFYLKKGARIFKVLHINVCINQSFIFFHFYAKIIHYFYWQYWDSVWKYSSMYLHVLWRGSDHNSGLCLVKA